MLTFISRSQYGTVEKKIVSNKRPRKACRKVNPEILARGMIAGPIKPLESGPMLKLFRYVGNSLDTVVILRQYPGTCARWCGRRHASELSESTSPQP